MTRIHYWSACLAWLEPFWILLLAIPIVFPGKAIPLGYQPYALLGLFLFWPLRWGAYGRISRRSPVDWGIAFLLLWLPVNLWASAYLTTSWIAAGYFLFGLTLYIALINWPPLQRKPQWAAWLLLLVAGSLTIASPLLTAWKRHFHFIALPLFDQMQTRLLDLDGTIHANILAGALVVALPLFVSLAIQKNGSQTDGDRWGQMVAKGFYVLMALVAGGVVVLTQSRGGYLALAVALPLLFMLRWPWLRYAVPLLIVIVFPVLYWFGLDALLNKLSANGALDSWSGRIDIWSHSLDALHDFAFTGIGIGTFTLVLPSLYPLRVSIGDFPHAHNHFLQIGLDLGAPGLAAYISIMINVFIMAVALYRRRHSLSSLHAALVIGSIAALVGMFVHGILDAALWGTKLAFLPWVLFALVTMLYMTSLTNQPLEDG